jgi:SAM-dependent methyltransferase
VSSQELVESYDQKYGQANYFRYRRWLYRPFVKALIARAGLKPGDRLLDAGCGQGFFTRLFAEHAINAVGVDISVAGISVARRANRSFGAVFEAADVLGLKCANEFDCVFSRSCSLYNSKNFEVNHEITDRLLVYVRPGGILIFDYYSKLGGKKISKQWVYHSIVNVQNHFSRYRDAEVYFSLRFDAMLLGKLAFTRSVTHLSAQLSHWTGIGGELIALVRKTGV